jgi:spore germination protein YaaH
MQRGLISMKLILRLVVVALFAATVRAETRPVSLFYMTETPDSVRSFMAHSGKIGLLVPMWYTADANGLVSGGPNPLVMEVAQKEHLPVMPIVVAAGKDAFHTLLGNPTGEKAMIAALIRESTDRGYTGFQFDFEDISWTDRDALSALVKSTADALHGEGLKLSIATVPNAPGYPGKGGFAKWIYEDWRGAYDLAAIGQSVDLVCLMTYDQNTRWTMPGPVAGWNWTVENLDYALKFVPKEKLSLGIPVYGYHWYAGAPIRREDPETKKVVEYPNATGDYIGAPNAELLAKEYKGTIQWDPDDRTAWFYINRDQMREWVFFTDKRTFEERYKLVQERGLEGFCSWVLGEEDPAIWELLPDRK